jgi:hypothetical protein
MSMQALIHFLMMAVQPGLPIPQTPCPQNASYQYGTAGMTSAFGTFTLACTSQSLHYTLESLYFLCGYPPPGTRNSFSTAPTSIHPSFVQRTS